MNKENETVFKKATVIKIAIDMHLRNYRVVRQIDQSSPQPAARFTPEAFYLWLEKQRGLGERVVVCYEAGCFGYEPARRMQGMGAEVYVIAPQNWDEQGKRQVNDKHDALVMCRRLSEYLCGHSKALRCGAHTFAGRGSAPGGRADARAITAGAAAAAGDGAQPVNAKGVGGSGALVAGEDLRADGAVRGRLAGEVEKSHRATNWHARLLSGNPIKNREIFGYFGTLRVFNGT